MEDGNNNVEDRIKELERQRADELESRKWMSSCPERPNSYGRYEFFEKSECMLGYSVDLYIVLILCISLTHYFCV